MSVDWDAIQKASKQLEDNMKNAHNEINEMSFTAISENQLIHVDMKGNFDIQSLDVVEEKLDTNMPSAELAIHVANECATAVDSVVKQIRQYSNDKIKNLANAFDKSIAEDSTKE